METHHVRLEQGREISLIHHEALAEVAHAVDSVDHKISCLQRVFIDVFFRCIDFLEIIRAPAPSILKIIDPEDWDPTPVFLLWKIESILRASHSQVIKVRPCPSAGDFRRVLFKL
jgi:hypothetical protein